MSTVAVVNQTLAFLTLISDITISIFLLTFTLGLIKLNQGIGQKLIKYLNKKAYVFAYIVALTATLGSLFYSEIAHYQPCKLCWYQRIFMYSQVPLLLVALVKKQRQIADYLLSLSLIGAVIALYHYLLQIGIITTYQCSEVGYSITCSDSFTLNYGYITIPVMALTAFTLIILLMLTSRIKKAK